MMRPREKEEEIQKERAKRETKREEEEEEGGQSKIYMNMVHSPFSVLSSLFKNGTTLEAVTGDGTTLRQEIGTALETESGLVGRKTDMVVDIVDIVRTGKE